MKTAKKKHLKKIEMELTDNGFTIWMKHKGRARWLIDGSVVLDSGKISLGVKDRHTRYAPAQRFEAVYDNLKNKIVIVDHGKEYDPAKS